MGGGRFVRVGNRGGRVWCGEGFAGGVGKAGKGSAWVGRGARVVARVGTGWAGTGGEG